MLLHLLIRWSFVGCFCSIFVLFVLQLSNWTPLIYCLLFEMSCTILSHFLLSTILLLFFEELLLPLLFSGVGSGGFEPFSLIICLASVCCCVNLAKITACSPASLYYGA